MKRPELLGVVALEKDLPKFRLRAGDIGVVVEVYPRDDVEVEFTDRDGETVAVLTLRDEDVREATDADMGHHPVPLPPGTDIPWVDATQEKTRRG